MLCETHRLRTQALREVRAKARVIMEQQASETEVQAPTLQARRTGARRKTRRRHEAIVNAALTRDLTTYDLSVEFGVTESTIRRDLQRLAAEGRIARTYGGLTYPLERDTSQKTREHRSEKAAIAQLASTYIQDHETVILDAGTTVGSLGALLRHRKGLVVITAGLTSLFALRDATDIELVILGGRLRQINQGMVGPLAEHALDLLSADKLFLGAEGVDPERGICCPTLDQATLKRSMITRANEVFLLADSTKLMRAPFRYWAPLPKQVRLITDKASREFSVPFLAGEPKRVIEVATVPVLTGARAGERLA